MSYKEKLSMLDEAQATDLLRMAEIGYKYTHPVLQKSDKRAYDSLMSMVGCTDAKAKIKEVLASERMSKISRARGKHVPTAHYHMAFLGAPGSCKTTTARLYAEILFAEGIIKSKDLVELSRASLVAKYSGHTADLVRTKMEENRGKAILIDEAYSLNDTDSHTASATYGAEAIDELILQLEKLTDTVVIFAGYTEKMQSFLDANPGLRSRIPILVSFPDYTTPELLAICRTIAQERGYVINDNAENRLFDLLGTARLQPNFGNGRFCRNLVEHAISEKSLKLGLMDAAFDYSKFTDKLIISDEELFTLDADCFNGTYETRAQERRIGF